MKKLLLLFLSVLCLISLLTVTVQAEDEKKEYVYVTIADENGNIVLTAKNIQYQSDMTIDDALRAAHNTYHPDKESAYATETTEYGISMTKFWGVSNGGAYGYMINNMSPQSLADPIKAGDHIYAYIYTDTNTFSDTYSFFDILAGIPDENGNLTLTLTKSGFDENFMPKHEPVAGAVITLNGEKTDFITNENGQVTIFASKAGTYTVSAEKEGLTLVPPVCLFTTTGYTYVSIYDESGNFVLTYEPIFVTDLDKDGMITINDALLKAHAAFKEGGYSSALDAYGELNIISLWGVAGKQYECYIDGSRMYRLTERLSSENHIQAFISTDAAYSYFDKTELVFENGKTTITLQADTMLESGHYLSKPIAGAEILVNGEKIGKKTDQNGKFTLSVKDLKEDDLNIISAVAKDSAIIPPVLAVSLQNAENTPSSPNIPSVIWLLLIIVLITALVFGIRIIWSKKKVK